MTKGRRRRGKTLKYPKKQINGRKTLFFSGDFSSGTVMGGFCVRMEGAGRRERVKSRQLSVQVYAIIVAHHDRVMCGWFGAIDVWTRGHGRGVGGAKGYACDCDDYDYDGDNDDVVVYGRGGHIHTHTRRTLTP